MGESGQGGMCGQKNVAKKDIMDRSVRSGHRTGDEGKGWVAAAAESLFSVRWVSSSEGCRRLCLAGQEFC